MKLKEIRIKYNHQIRRLGNPGYDRIYEIKTA